MFNLNQANKEAWKARIGIIFVLAFFASITSFLRTFPFGYDSYASILCQMGKDCGVLGFQPLMVALLQVLPYHPLILNFIFWIICFVSFLALFLIGLHFCKDEKKVWLILMILISFCPFFVFHLHEWENELFAYPLLLWGLWFLLKGKWFPSVCLFGLSLGFWGGGIFVLVSWGLWLTEGFLLFPFVAAYFIFKDSVLGFLIPTKVSESILGIGLLDLFVLVGVLPFALGFGAGEYFLALGLITGLSFVVLQGKFVVVLVPFVLLGLVKVLELLEKKGLSLNLMFVLSFLMLFGMNLAFYNAEPTIYQMKNVIDSIKLAKDNNLPYYNDWSYGYWVEYQGQDTNYKGGFPNPDYNNLNKPFVALTDSNLTYLDCDFQSKQIWKC